MTRRIVLCLAMSLTTLALAAGTASAKLTFFKSPSGNIGCAISGKFVRCDIRNHSWPTPAPPPSCDVDYGFGVSVGKHGRGSFVCAGDTVFDPSAKALPYGDRISAKRMRCASKQKGMRCVNRKSKHGFFLSAQDVRLF
jgi:hypothetical protein